MSRPWMPLYIADYRADTAHLSAAEHGAYLLLIMHYWTTGSLPKEDTPLARIACMSPSEWRKAKTTIAKFFDDEWRHKRIDAELARASEISSKRRASAEQRHNKSAANGHANAEQVDTQPQSHTEPNGSGETPSRKKQLFDRGREVLGPKSGGVIAELLRTFGKEDDPFSISKAFARIEEASTKAKPMEWLQKTMRPKAGEFKLMSGIEGVI